jgi:HEAT repeat protein
MSNDPQLTGDEPSLSVLPIPTTGSEPQLTGEQLILHYIALLEDPDWQIRNRVALAIQALGETGLGILRKAVNHSDWHVRRSAVKAADGIPSAESASLLFELLADAHPHVRQDAVDALGSMFERTSDSALHYEITRHLMLLTTQDTHRGVQGRAYRQLKKVSAIAYPHLIDMLDDPTLAEDALFMLRRLDSSYSMITQGSEAAHRCLLLMLQNDAFYNQHLYFIASKVDHLAAVLLDLEARTEGDQQRAVRKRLCINVIDARSIPSAIQLIHDSESTIGHRRAAFRLFGKLRDREVLPLIERILREERDYTVWNDAVWALYQIEGQNSFPKLYSLIKERPDMRLYVLGLFSQLRTSEAVQAIMEYASDPVIPIRAEVMVYLKYALVERKADVDVLLIQEMIHILANALADDVRVRSRAIYALDIIQSSIPDLAFVKTVIIRRFVDLTFAWVRLNFQWWEWSWVLVLMRDLADPIAVPFLTNAENDTTRIRGSNQTVGQVAAEALARIEARGNVAE